MSFTVALDTIHRWLLDRPFPLYVLILAVSTMAMILAFGLGMEWPARVGPPAMWLIDAAVLILFWSSHFRFRYREDHEDGRPSS